MTEALLALTRQIQDTADWCPIFIYSTECYISGRTITIVDQMSVALKNAIAASRLRIRVFATRRFAADARRAGIVSEELCKVARGWSSQGSRGTPLGAGVVKARLRNGNFRGLRLEKEEVWVIFAYLFDKQDEKNIGPKALNGFKKLARDFRCLPAKAFEEMLRAGALVEICKND